LRALTFRRRKAKETKILDSQHVPSKLKKEGEFHTLFGRLNDDRQKFFKYFRMSFSKFENLKQVLHTDIEKKNTRWRQSIKTEERLALTLRLVHKNV
jgi:hypothetical protein